AFARLLSDDVGETLKRCKFIKACHRRDPQEALNQICSIIVNKFHAAAQASIPIVHKRPNSKWWWRDPEMKQANRRVRAARNGAKQKTVEGNREWNSARSNFKRVTKECKERCWANFCERLVDTSTNTINWQRFNAATREPRH